MAGSSYLEGWAWRFPGCSLSDSIVDGDPEQGEPDKAVPGTGVWKSTGET